MLRLQVKDFAGPTSWRWLLTEAEGGSFVADHEVSLDASAWQFEAFQDLERYLRWRAAPDRRLANEAEITAQVGDWVTEHVLGPVGEALARRRGPVLLEIASEAPGARVLGYRPWELARVDGRALAAQRVSFVIDMFVRPLQDKVPVGQRLRMLAVFSLPEDASALNLRRERFALARLVEDLAASNGRAVELRVLQYGATRDRLEDALLEAAGWDVLHISGHGLPAGLLLETDTGARDLVTSRELVELLELAADSIKLVTLSSCESAALTAAGHLSLLGMAPTPPSIVDGTAGPTADAEVKTDGSAAPGLEALPAVAAALVDRLDCAVVAMRFPVIDDFAIKLSGSFYPLVLGKGQPVARALALSLPRVLTDPPTPAAPPLSVATPALFGPRAATLRLHAPPGEPLVFQAERVKLAAFQPQPEHFVGRVGPMTRATAALATRSGKAGVLFHGMVGAGKTACALELAYTHEQSFGRLVWHQAPTEGADISGALTNLALDLETQIPGLALVHAIEDTAVLTRNLPVVAEFFRTQRVLLVLDNLESLLRENGEWRDPRWALVIDALAGRAGQSRLVLTSRRRPAGLPTGMLVEPVHALSLTESVLLARELPHLRALIDAQPGDFGFGGRAALAGEPRSDPRGLSPDEARALAARALAVVQGHPKLLELADGQAADPGALKARLDEADTAWLDTGTPLESFVRTGEPEADAAAYTRVLQGWARATATALPGPAATLFHILCCLEPDDRTNLVLVDNWADIWQRLNRPNEAPDSATALPALVDAALLAIETAPTDGSTDTDLDDPGEGADGDNDGAPLARYRIHPGVAESGRAAAGGEVAAAVDAELAAYWRGVLHVGLQAGTGEVGWLVLHAARAAIPYLARRRDWATLNGVLQEVIARDNSRESLAALLPALHAAASATIGTPQEVLAGRNLGRALIGTDPDRAEALLRRQLTSVVERSDHANASALVLDLVKIAMARGQLDEALTLTEHMKEHTREAGYGPWTQLTDEGQRLQILLRQGHFEQVLEEFEAHRATMAELPWPGEQPECVSEWNVREIMFDTARSAAAWLGQWQQALDLNAETLHSTRQRRATDLEITRTAFNDYGPLLRLGRFAEARTLLQGCQAVFADAHELGLLSKTVGGLADLEDKVSHGDFAIALQREALRLSYAAREVEGSAMSHHNLANYLERHGGDIEEQWAHRLAGAIIWLQFGDAAIGQALRGIANLMDSDEARPLGSFEHVCAIVNRIDGVSLDQLVAGLPRRAPDGQAALEQVLDLASDFPNDGERTEGLLRSWEPVISALLADARGNAEAGAVLDASLDAQGETRDWQQLLDRLRHLRAGDRDPDVLLAGLDDIDTLITRRALHAMTTLDDTTGLAATDTDPTGADPVDRDAWRTLLLPEDDVPGQEMETAEFVTHLGALTVAAALGDANAATDLRDVLTSMRADPSWAGLANALDLVLAGDRDRDRVLEGLEPHETAVVTTALDQLTTPQDYGHDE